MPHRILHFEPFGGASGDMILGALLDLGVSEAVIDDAIASAGLEGARLEVTTSQRHGVSGRRVRFVDGDGAPIDPLEAEPALPPQDHSAAGTHAHWPELRRRIEGAPLAPAVRARALEIFTRLADAEAQVHGVDAEAVALHEVGSADAIADVVGAAAAIDALCVDRITCAPIPLGGDAIRAAHGVLPAPAPATALLCTGAEVRGIDVGYECTTPTGAAVLTTVAQAYSPLPGGVLRRVGVGLGRRDPSERANLLRAYVVEIDEAALSSSTEELVEVTANLDDETGEVCAFTIERLLEAGALDAWATAATMKKGRPSVVLSALVPTDRSEKITDLLMRETTTFGTRLHAVSRRVLRRTEATVETPYGPVRVKKAWSGDRLIKAKPEFEDCARSARHHGVALRTVQRAAERAVRGPGEE